MVNDGDRIQGGSREVRVDVWEQGGKKRGRGRTGTTEGKEGRARANEGERVLRAR